jgi:hypothetical protein
MHSWKPINQRILRLGETAGGLKQGMLKFSRSLLIIS